MPLLSVIQLCARTVTNYCCVHMYCKAQKPASCSISDTAVAHSCSGRSCHTFNLTYAKGTASDAEGLLVVCGVMQDPWGVALGATAACASATALAVLVGAVAAKYVSERTVNCVSGVLFLVFAAVSAVAML